MAEGPPYDECNLLGNAGTSTFDSGLPDMSLRLGDTYQNLIDWSFDDTIDSVEDDIPSYGSGLASGSATSGSETSGSSEARKKVQFASDSDKLPAYKMHKNSMCKVNFPGKTWDIMMQGFRIALEMDNVFICNDFMGKEGAIALLQELWFLRNTGVFDEHMREGPLYRYSCLYMLEQNKSHRQLDALVLMVYKLALYYTDEWNKISVEICYYPEGHTVKKINTEEYESERKILKCTYFPNNDWCTKEGDDDHVETEGLYVINTPNRVTRVEPVMDRLVVFWGDILKHTVGKSSKEGFAINVYIKR